jgi:hypothetical protein
LDIRARKDSKWITFAISKLESQPVADQVTPEPQLQTSQESITMPQPVPIRKPPLPHLVNTQKAAELLGRSTATLKRWRAEGVGPNWIELQGRVSYDVNVLLEYIQKNTRVASVRAAMEEAREAV